MDRLEGTIERITYQNEETGYTVAKLEPKGRSQQLITVVGEMASASPGENVALEGFWTHHPQYGRQFKITGYKTVYPSTVEGIRKYLGSGLIKGIGPVTAKSIVVHFGLDTLRVIEEEPDRLLEVEGLGPKRLGMIKDAWEEQKEIKDIMLFLQSHSVSTSYAVKIYKQYQDESIQVVRDNPYRLASDVWGIGFITADKIAKNVGIEDDSPQRIKAGIKYVLSQCSEDGHVFVPEGKLLEECSKSLGVQPDLVPSGLKALDEEKEVIIEKDRVYLPPLFYSEVGVASGLEELMNTPGRRWGGDVKKEVNNLERKWRITLAERQRLAIEMALRGKVMVITGGPGTGKTTITRGIIELFERRGRRVALTAPTGRAAKRLSEATGREAKTIHRLLEFNPQKGGFQRDRDDPLKADVVIVDEVSMVDTILMNSLLKAIPRRSTLILVGDVDQLPSVGPGNVLKDIIDSGFVPVVELNEIFRQAKKSVIVVNAHRINRGEFPYIKNRRSDDFFFIEEEDPGRIPEIIRDLCVRRLPGYYRYHPIEDIQVISPMYRGETGATNLNSLLQENLNPNGQGFRRGGTEYRVGDKVMQVRNNYEKMVFNGDIGRIREIDLEDGVLEVAFDEPVTYDLAELDELVPAYSISVHKSQGSEYKAVVMPITTQHYMMLQRNLLYTAVTRARELVVLVGTKKALGIAVRNNKVVERYTALTERLTEAS